MVDGMDLMFLSYSLPSLMLIEHGAPATLFSATMLGQLDLVKAFLAAMPGGQRMRGPHSFS